MQLPLMITERDRALKAMQSVLLEGLKEIDRICRKHGIKYSLGGGTCLGQIRHGGFIPWDDDIDIDMTTENFDKFIEIAPLEIDTSRFSFYTRKNDPSIRRSFARLGIKGTALTLKNWDSIGREYNIYIDILSCNYLPDDEKKRKKVASRLFLLRCVQHYKELGLFATTLDPKYKPLVRTLGAAVPDNLLEKYEHRLTHCTDGRTGWILDDTIIHGDYGGYRSEGVDEYTDVEFEGLTVMNKKDPHDFLVSLYGEKYMEWLPPTKRISHHVWTTFDLGSYADGYDLSDDYKDFMTINYSPAKLRQMKVVSDSMVAEITDLCDRNGIKYTIADINETGISRDIEDLQSLWVQPAIIMMLRDEYEKFSGICKDGIGNRLSFQSHDTDRNYYFDHARVHLKHTYIRDNRIRLLAENKLDNGFYVKIIPMDDYCKTADAEKAFKKMRFWRRILYLKWRTPDAEYFRKASLKNKIKLIYTHRESKEDVYGKISRYAETCRGIDCEQCFDSSYQLGGQVFNKKDLLNNRKIEVIRSSIKADTLDELVASVSSRFGPCYLTYYDEPERQLSILRYDEKADRLLTNEEL